MKFSQEFSSQVYHIYSYDPELVTIVQPVVGEGDNPAKPNIIKLTDSFIIGLGRLLENWAPSSLAELDQSAFADIESFSPEVVLLGVGGKLRFPDQVLYQNLINKRIGVEIMDSAAACRTYDILVSEGRNVVAAIILD